MCTDRGKLCTFMQFENLEQLCNDPRARRAVLAEMDAVGKEDQVNSSNQVCFSPLELN